MSKPRILFVLRYHLSRFTGGAEMQSWMMATELARRGWDVHYASESAEITGANPLEGVTRHALPEDPSYWKGNRAPLRALLRELKPDVVYTRAFDSYLGYAVKDKPQGTKVVWAAASKNDARAWPFLVQGWRMLPPHLFVKRLPVFLYWNFVARGGRAGADLVLAQHRDQQEQFRRLGIKSVVLRNSHPLVPESDVQAHQGRPMILWADSIKPIKRPEVFLELAKRHAHHPADFVMIGSIYDSRYKPLIEETKRLAPNFRYDGFIPLAEVDRYFRAAHIHVKTSLPIEGFPNTFVQSWMYGVPVVSLETDPEGFLHDLGLGVRCMDLNSLDRAVEQFIMYPERRREVGRLARRVAVEEFELQQNMDKFERLIAEKMK